jgi:hypothetical protein
MHLIGMILSCVAAWNFAKDESLDEKSCEEPQSETIQPSDTSAQYNSAAETVDIF